MKKQDLLIPLVMLAIGAGVGFMARIRSQSQLQPASPQSMNVGASVDDAGQATVPTQTTTAESESTPDAPGRYPTFAEMNTQAAPGYTSALPPLDAKVVDVYAQLHERAAQGDGRAACRLAIELQQCADRDFMLQGADRAAQMLDEQQQRDGSKAREATEWEARRQRFAQQQIDYALQLDDRCKGVSEDQLVEHADLWRRAAMTGHVPSMVHYAKGDGFRMRATLDNLERLATYKSEAERMMRAAAAAGSAEAMQQLLDAYRETRNPWSGLLQQAIKADPVEAAAIAQLARERGVPVLDARDSRWNRRGDASVSEPQPLSGSQAAVAEQRAAALRQQWPTTGSAPDMRESPWDRMRRMRESCDSSEFTSAR